MTTVVATLYNHVIGLALPLQKIALLQRSQTGSVLCYLVQRLVSQG